MKRLLLVMTEGIVSQFYSNNKNAEVKLLIPDYYSSIEFDGVGIIDRNTGLVKTLFKIR